MSGKVRELLGSASNIELTRFHSVKSDIFTTDKIVDLLSKYVVRPVDYKELDGDLHYMTYAVLDVRGTNGCSEVCGSEGDGCCEGSPTRQHVACHDTSTIAQV